MKTTLLKTLHALLILTTTLFCQFNTAQNTELFIPYYANGKWGYCDVNGNILIPPTYNNKTTFFFSFKGQDFAYVVNNDGRTILIDKNNNNLLPEDCFISNSPDISYLLKHGGLVESSSKKQGLYDYKKLKVTVPIVYDSIFDFNHQIIAKKKNKYWVINYNEYNEQYKQIQTDYIDLEILRNLELYIYKTSDKIYKDGEKGKREEITYEDYAALKKKDFETVVEEFIIESTEILGGGHKYFVNMKGSDEINKTPDNNEIKVIKNIGFSKRMYEKKCGYKELNIVQKGDKIGITDENMNLILPIAYDEIQFDYYYSKRIVYIKKGDLVGLKFLMDPCHLIEPNYDSIEVVTFIPEKDFYIFLVKKNNINLYVGENGIEFFKLD
ncbi:WG repeat-containing protein [Flavivirga algicola]|uniref:WG repeat-containing protein n=1 Tax=Flavivirga algicola TaxID=2729136 RepID=A0ABX1S0P7_9FLAO|nr:WG repeat-containing protein [Flavivirga algicola]NMH88926.1 hypothetical protein [Flavivirga algicola]